MEDLRMGQPGSIEELRKAVSRPASVASPALRRPTGSPTASVLGDVRCAAEGEDWPHHGDEPMVGVAQLNLREAPYAPAVLAGIEFISLFVADEGGWWAMPDDHPNGDGWLVRAYPAAGALVPLAGPQQPLRLRPRELDWRQVEDVPDREDVDTFVDLAGLEESLGLPYEEAVGHASDGTKLGGWPRLIQSEIRWPEPPPGHVAFEFAFQIDSDEKVGLNWTDGGVFYVARSPGSDVWVAETQFM